MLEELGVALIKSHGSLPGTRDDCGQKEKKQKWIRDEKVIGWRGKSLTAIMDPHVYITLPICQIERCWKVRGERQVKNICSNIEVVDLFNSDLKLHTLVPNKIIYLKAYRRHSHPRVLFK